MLCNWKGHLYGTSEVRASLSESGFRSLLPIRLVGAGFPDSAHQYISELSDK